MAGGLAGPKRLRRQSGKAVVQIPVPEDEGSLSAQIMAGGLAGAKKAPSSQAPALHTCSTVMTQFELPNNVMNLRPARTEKGDGCGVGEKRALLGYWCVWYGNWFAIYGEMKRF